MTGTVCIRRVCDEAALLASLEQDAPDVLPLCFSDAEREWIGRTVAPQLARLAPGDEMAVARSSISAGPHDIVLSNPSSPESLLARRYAAITRRGLTLAAPASAGAALVSEPPRSVTWFPTLERTDLGAMYDELHGGFVSALGVMPRLGVLTGESLAKLTWVLAKQLLPRGEPTATTPATTIVAYEGSGVRLSSSVKRLSRLHSNEEMLAGFDQARGTLLVVGHSRAHCGLMPTANGLVGLCGLASGGAGGRCADGGPCSFDERHRTVLHDIDADRVFFNSCSTAIVDSPRLPHHLPRSAMVGHALLRSRVREYIGNVRIGCYGELDLHWLLGASALGYTPAECIPIIEAVRSSTGREVLPSSLYFGDATNPVWPVECTRVGDVTVESDAVARVRWSRSDTILVARVPGRSWAQLAALDRLDVLNHDQPPRHGVSILPDPWSDASLVLAVSPVTTEEQDPEQPLALELSVRPEPLDRSVGGILEETIQQVDWLQSLPSFEAPLAGLARTLGLELVKMRSYAALRDDITMISARLDYLRAAELSLVRYVDELLLHEKLYPNDAPVDMTKDPFDWVKEHEWRMASATADRAASCSICGALMFSSLRTDYINPRIKRMHTGCSHCGLADLPVCDLRLTILPGTIVSPTKVTGVAQVFNDGDRARSVTLAAVLLETFGRRVPSSVPKQTLTLEPKASASFELSLETEDHATKKHRVRVYLASEGTFGMIHQILVFPEDAAPS